MATGSGSRFCSTVWSYDDVSITGGLSVGLADWQEYRNKLCFIFMESEVRMSGVI